MSLGDVLSDIKDNTENIITDNNLSTENIEISGIKANGTPISIERFSKETLAKVNNMFNLVILQSNVKELPKVDYALAQEVFTMIPDLPKSESAKLTSNPSMINKEILEKVFNTNIDNKVSIDISDKIYELRALIENNLEKFDEVYKYLESFKQLTETKIQVLNNVPPIVIERKFFVNDEENKNKNVNLYSDKISDIISLDDTKMEYEKYTNTLVEKYNRLYSDETLKEISSLNNYFNLPELSLKMFITAINSLGESLQCKETDLKNYVNGLNSINDSRSEIQLNTETIDYINGYDSVAYDLECLSKVYTVIKVEDNCFTKVVELLNFLD